MSNNLTTIPTECADELAALLKQHGVKPPFDSWEMVVLADEISRRFQSAVSRAMCSVSFEKLKEARRGKQQQLLQQPLKPALVVTRRANCAKCAVEKPFMCSEHFEQEFQEANVKLHEDAKQKAGLCLYCTMPLGLGQRCICVCIQCKKPFNNGLGQRCTCLCSFCNKRMTDNGLGQRCSCGVPCTKCNKPPNGPLSARCECPKPFTLSDDIPPPASGRTFGGMSLSSTSNGKTTISSSGTGENDERSIVINVTINLDGVTKTTMKYEQPAAAKALC